MPYIITTKPPGQPCESCPHEGDHVLDPATGEHVEVTSRAVATLEEARGEAAEIVLNVWDVEGQEGVLGEYEPHLIAARDDLPESGGTIALPDGTVIEVERVSWARLCGDVAKAGNAAACTDLPAILDAFNAARED